MLRKGVIGELQGMMIGYSDAAKTKVTKGTGASYVINGAHAVGATSITLKTGTGTVLVGDTLTFQGDSAKYIVTANPLAAPGTLTIGSPGLLIAQSDGNTATLTSDTRSNVLFSSNAIQLVTRAPAVPDGGDAADDRTLITDPVSGLAFEVAVYRQYRRVHYEVAIAWGAAAVKSDDIATLLA
jgi:hypothetical protein